MANPSETRVLGDPVIVTAETFARDTYQDVVFEPSPLFSGVFGAARMPGTPKGDSKFPWAGKGNLSQQDGREVWIPVATGASTNTQAFSRSSTLNLNVDDIGTVQRSEYTNYTEAAAILKVEAWENTGPQRRLDLYKERTNQALRSLASRIEGDAWSANADVSDGVQEEVVGLQTLISTGTTNTVWKLSRTTYSFQRNNTTNAAAAFATNGLSSMRTMYTNCAGNGSFDVPSVIATTPVLLNAYEAELEDRHQITSTMNPDAGMQMAHYKGIPMFCSDNCLTGAMYFINLGYMYVIIPTGGAMESEHYPASSFPNQPVKEAIRYYLRMTWGFSRFDRQGVIYGFTDM